MPKSKSRRKHKNPHRASESEAGNAGGVMSSLRGGFKRVAAGERKGGSRTPAQRALDIAFWVLVLAAVVFFAIRRFR